MHAARWLFPRVMEQGPARRTLLGYPIPMGDMMSELLAQCNEVRMRARVPLMQRSRTPHLAASPSHARAALR